MYPKNAAFPEKVSIGAVVQISDGAVQTSGCTVRIIPSGGAEGDGAGTTAYSTDGVVLYTPTQGETNYASFILIAKKTGCIPASVTVITTLSPISGQVVAADTQKVDLNTIKTQTVTAGAGVAILASVGTATTSTAQTGDSFARIGAAGAGLTGITGVVLGPTQTGVTIPVVTTVTNPPTDMALNSTVAKDATVSKPGTAQTITAPADMATNTLLTTVAGYLDTEIAAILADTNELQTNQGNWITATGFATPTNITAGTITTVTNLTNAPTSGDLTATMKTSLNSATPTVTVSDKTGFSLTVTPPTAVENADALLNRDMSTGTDSGSPTVRTVRQALRFLRNKWSISGNTLTVTKENDTDTSWTSTVATDAGAVPVVGNDPA